MADFVAVIRRAVDGLAKNTPEMREKVYDKARGAVRRQLENMKPAPPEAMIHRQMEKLESAILSVEAEHAEALPAEEAVTPVPEAAREEWEAVEPAAYDPASTVPAQWPDEQAPQPDETHPHAHVVEEEPFAAPQDAAPQQDHDYDQQAEQPSEPAHEERAYEERAYEEPVHAEQAYEEPAYEEPAYGEQVQQEPVYDEPVQEHAAPFASDNDQGWASAEEPGSAHAVPAESWPAEEPAEPQQSSPEPIGLWPASDQHLPVGDEQPQADSFAREAHGDHAPAEQQPADDAQSAWQDEPAAAAPAEDDNWQWPAPNEAPERTEAAWDDVPDLTVRDPEGIQSSSSAAEPVEAHFDEQTYASASSVRMPSTEDFPVFGQPAAPAEPNASEDFEDALRNQDRADAVPASPRDPWEDIEELIGYNQNAVPAARADEGGGGADADMDMPPPPPARPYRVAPKKRNFAGPILGLIGLIIIGAGGYALWLNRDALTEVVGLAEPPAATAPVTTPSADEAAQEADGAAAPATEEPAAEQPETAQEGDPAAPAAPAAEDVAATSKFTQRLLPDGTEVDEGPGVADGTGEGQSVAQLNAPPATPAEAAASAPPAQDEQAEPSATPADAAALSGEKMFLYEERVGQTAPTAIEGAVSWSLQREADGNGQPEPVIQGRVNIPGRGLTALLTFKRNTDASLPASHLVEVVCAIPPGFEGGTIDSVQRIAMKQTEQDRGDALIAVPAKITDDFHMIALNDFPDARATNLELLRSRNWMDIPLAYRNGRRALLTLQKGEEGARIFNEAITEWQALTDNTSTGQ